MCKLTLVPQDRRHQRQHLPIQQIDGDRKEQQPQNEPSSQAVNGNIPPVGLMDMPVEELERRARLPFRLFPDLPSLLTHFAQSIAGEIRANNGRGEPTRLIVPVGPVGQYPQLAEITNRERLSWKNVFLFQMDEFLDWQGRPLPLTHPLSFEACLRTRLLAAIDEDLRPPADHL